MHDTMALALRGIAPPARKPEPHTPTPWPEFRIGLISREDYDRARACVNACAGMDDPAREIRALREQAHYARFKR